MPQPGSGSILGNLVTQRSRLSAVRQKIGLEAAQRGAPQSNLRAPGPPPRPKTAAPAAPQRRAAAPASAPARGAAPQQPAADGREQMLAQVTEFLGQVQQAAPRPAPQAPQSRGEVALGRARTILAGGLIGGS